MYLYNCWGCFVACTSTGDVDALQALSCCESTFQERDGRGWMPLHAAAVQPHPEMLQVVLQGEISNQSFGGIKLEARFLPLFPACSTDIG